MQLIAALENYARWLRYDLDRPNPERVGAARERVVDLLCDSNDERLCA